MLNEHYYAVIMAGGGGTRLWPLSRQTRPKQMLSGLFGDRTLFQIAVDRLRGVFPPERICVVTVQEQALQLQAQCPQIPVENYLIEPGPRGTASVVGLAAVALQQRDPQAVMAILTSDHYIGDEPRFRDLLGAAYLLAEEGRLVTLGIEPTFPSTGFGYIQSGEPLGEVGGLEAFHVRRFLEKPDESTARSLLEEGGYTWNSGMFIWRVDRILCEFERQMPALYSVLQEVAAAWDGPGAGETLQRVWPGLRPETIDYGIMEGAAGVAIIPAAGLGWNDVGSWDALFDVLPAGESGNIVLGAEHRALDSSRSLIYSEQGERLIVTIGLDDLVVVDTGDVLLVCRKDQAQRVRQVVNELKNNGGKYL